MNKVILMGRPTADPEIWYGTGENSLAIGRYTLAVNRRFIKDGEQEADFIRCVAFGKAAEFVEKWIKKGTKIVVTGRIQTGSYTNQEGAKIYTTEVVIEEQEFAESKKGETAETAEKETTDNSSEVSAGKEKSPEQNPNVEDTEGTSQEKESKPIKKTGKKKTKEGAENSGNN